MIPSRRKRPKMGVRQPGKIVCPGHGKWVRTRYVCAFAGLKGKTPLGKEILHECQGRMESHHVETRGAGGGDEQQIPLCHLGHTQHHNGYWFPVDQEQMAAELWKADTYHRQKYERSQMQQDADGAPQGTYRAKQESK